jgi:ATP-dependent Zn protease
MIDQHRALAVHEAGHAIVAHGLGQRVRRAVISINGDIAAGHVESEETQSMSLPDRIALCSAGGIAQDFFKAPVNDYCLARDTKQLYELIGRMVPAVGQTLREIGYEKAHELIERNQAKVAAFADALAERQELSEDEIAALLR